jgi:hypothetical protein
MKWIPSMALSVLALAGCAGTGGPIYEFRPTDGPLHYRVSDHSALRVETPVGDQTATDSTHATVAIEIADESDGRRAVVVSFSALEFWSGGDFPKYHVVGDELIGQPFNGLLDQSGVINVTSSPDIPERVAEAVDAGALIAGFLPPLPPDGEAATTPWPHKTTVSINTAMSVEVSQDGTASFAGDTTWNGRPARVIVSEGIMTAAGGGRPAAAPGEVEFSYTGRYVTRYVWDPGSGVMLASATTAEADGELEVREMQLVMPVTYKGRKDVTLGR